MLTLLHFYIAIFLVFFLPGYFLMRVIFGKNYNMLASLEKLLITFVFSLSSIDAIMLLMNYLNIAITRKNLFLGIVGVSFVFGVAWVIRFKYSFWSRNQNRGRALPPTSLGSAEAASEKARPHSSFYVLAQISNLQSPSYRQILLFIVLLGFSVFIRSVYIADGIFPKTTDFGHHMYWANYINTNEKLPTYDEKFIIGEHLPFAAVSILSGIHYISPLAVVVLFLFNIFTLIGVFILVYWLAIPFNKVFQKIFPKIKKISPYDVALWGLFVIGILYPISAPQVKFVSGGVIGNVIGNLLIIVTIYTFLRLIISTTERLRFNPTSKNTNIKAKTFTSSTAKFSEAAPHPRIARAEERLQKFCFNPTTSFVILFLVSALTLVYTHHLSSFIFIYSFIAILLGFIILTLVFTKFNLATFFKLVLKHLQPFFALASLLTIVIGIFFIWQVRTPSYLNPSAIDVAVGTPTKITRVGFSLSEIFERVGSWRVLFAGIFGAIGLVTGWKVIKDIFLEKIRFQSITPFALILSILFSWAGIIFLMSWKPGLLKVDIPSRRIITYLTYPLTIMASFGIAYFFTIIRSKLSKDLATFLFLFFMGIGFISGFGQDITANQRTTAGKFEISSETNSKEVMQTYLASMYLAENTDDNEMILKDHKFLEGDTWMKIFFMRGYKYPLSRTYDRRYEDVIKKRETCTRDMVAKPNSEIGEKCFAETKTRFIVLKKGFDDAAFKKSPNFQQVYSSGTVTVFEKK